MGDFIIGSFRPACSFREPLGTLLCAFGKAFQHFIAHALDFKAVLGWLNPVADLLNPFRQFVPINRRAVTDGVIHFHRLQGFPAPFAVIKCGIKTVKCVCNCGSSSRRAVMHEGCGHEIAGRAITLTACLRTLVAAKFQVHGTQYARIPHGLQPIAGRPMSPPAPIRTGRCAGEIEKHPALVFFLLPLRQAFASFRFRFSQSA